MKASEGATAGRPAARLGELIDVSRLPAVIALHELAPLRGRLDSGAPAAELPGLLGEYYLGGEEVRAAFDLMVRSLSRPEAHGDAFTVAGVYGTGKSHLLAVLALLCGHPEVAWPVFAAAHPSYARAAAGFPRPRLTVAIALDAYPPATHSLEHIVFSGLEAELALRHGVRVALTQEAYLLELVQQHVLPQHAAGLEAAAREAGAEGWEGFARQDPAAAAEAALNYITRVGFPLDWRRSRAEAWGALRAALEGHGLDGPVLLLDELGLFLAGKERAGVNADAAFLQYLAQLTRTERTWLICVTQRGFDEAGDIDRRTLRQLRDRFRTGFVLDLAELGWVVEHKLVHPRTPESYRHQLAQLHASWQQGGADLGFSAEELRHSYPLNPLALQLLQRAAGTALSRTRSIVRVLQEAAHAREWLAWPATRLLTPDALLDLLQEEMSHSPEGRRVLAACHALEGLAEELPAERREEARAAIKLLALAGLAEVRWPLHRLRSSLVGGAQAALWQQPERLQELLATLYRRGGPVARARRGGEEADEYSLDLASTASEQVRQRLREVLAGASFTDTHTLTTALESCTDPTFPLAGLLESHLLPVEWHQARRFVTALCRDLSALSGEAVHNLTGALASPHLREEAALFLALPGDTVAQAQAWAAATAGLEGRAAAGLRAWLPRPLRAEEQEHLLEHAALARMVADPTLLRKRDEELRDDLRRRWADSEAEVRALLQRAYYEGQVLGPGGEVVLAPERLWELHGDWPGTLVAVFTSSFTALYPRFPTIAPTRRLAGRAQTNQLLDQFVRPGEVHLPPASALEAHLLAYAQPLGLAEGTERDFRLALPHAELLAEVLALAPPREGPLRPEHTLAFGELIGRLAKSEWGVTREQSELLVGALLHFGYLVPLDAFLQPVRFEQLAAPLSDFLPAVARGLPLEATPAALVGELWSAATGAAVTAWDLPTQERAWRELLAWSAALLANGPAHREALARLAETFGHPAESWAFAHAFLSRAEAVARGLDATRTAHEGLTRLLTEVARLPGEVPASAQALAHWRGCETFLTHHLPELASRHGLLCDARVRLPEDSMLAREHRALLAACATPDQLLAEAAALREQARRWLEGYRRHYLAWHARVHAPARVAPLGRLQQSPTFTAAARLGRAGLLPAEAAALQEEVRQALRRQCLAGDPLPEGQIVCPQCGLALGEEVPLPEAAGLAARAETLLTAQLAALREHADSLTCRAAASDDPAVRAALPALLAPEPTPEALLPHLTEPVLAWLARHREAPPVRQVHLRDLAARLEGKTLSAREVRRTVEAWLGPEEDETVEVVP